MLHVKLSLVARAFSPSTQEAATGKSLRSSANSDQLRIHSETKTGVLFVLSAPNSLGYFDYKMEFYKRPSALNSDYH